MRILIAHHVWRFDGETRFNLDLTKALCELGHHVSIAAVSRPAESTDKELKTLSCLKDA